MGPRPCHLAAHCSWQRSLSEGGVTVNSRQWDERYSGDELVWTSTPNQFLVVIGGHERLCHGPGDVRELPT